MSSKAQMEDRIAALVAGELSDAERTQLESQLDASPEWIAVLAALADGAPGSAGSRSRPDDTLQEIERLHRLRLRPGTRIGPYEIQREIGRGGMGIVYEARDDRLRRVVALKVLRDEADPERAISEARATARVRHDHVIEVFDAGRAEGMAWIAMERLEGTSLSAWLAERARPVPRVVEAFIAAGRGLHAAHVAGLVHRDFKPGNVFVTTTGRIVVLDFGLAADATESVTEPTTRAALPAGTPAYLAPEQRAGHRATARSDQFSFAVALFEALFGRLPATSLLAGTGSALPAAVGRVPRRIVTALRRASDPRPERRFDGMASLLAVLHGHSRRAWLPWWGAGLALVAGAGAWWTITPDPCAPTDPGVRLAWSDETAERLARRFADAPAADARIERIAEFADAWRAQDYAACRDGQADRRRARRSCLDQARHAFEAVTEVLGTSEPDPRALEAIDTLPDPRACESIRSSPSADLEDAARADAIERAIAQVAARRAAGDTSGAVEAASALADLATDLDDDVLAARAHLERGLALSEGGRHGEAETALWSARERGEAGSDDATVAEALCELAWVVGYKLARHDEGRELVRHAEASLDRIGRPPHLQLARLRTAGWIELDAGRPALAVQHFDDALAAADGPGVSPGEVALTLNGLAAAQMNLGDLDAAAAAFEHAEARLARLRGEHHVSLAELRNNLAAIRRAQGRVREAIAMFEDNLEVFRRAHGERSLSVGQTLVNLAVAHLDLGELSPVLAEAERALEIFREAVGDDHPMVAKARTLRGDARLQLGDPAGALEDFAFALEHERRSLGPDHPSVATVLTDMGSAYFALERSDEAVDHHRRALAILEAAWGDDHPDLSLVLVNLGLAERQRGRDDLARTAYERAVSIAGPTGIAKARTELAVLLIDAGEVEPARRLLDQATRDHALAPGDPVQLASTWAALARITEDPATARRLARGALRIFEAHDIDDAAARVRTLLRALPRDQHTVFDG